MKKIRIPCLVLVLALTAFAVLLLGGCSREKKSAAAPASIEVTAVTVVPKDTPVTLEFVGQTESSRLVEIRARVNGFLDKRAYEEGAVVKAGQIMFQMERSPYEAALQEARGELSVQEARLSQASANLGRIRPLAPQRAISKKDLDDAASNEQAAQAAVLSAEGKVRQAELNLNYTTIRSPVTGLSSRAKKHEGSYISAGPDSLLTYVAQLDPVWVNFSISENEALKQRDQETKGLLRLPKNNNFNVEVVLADGSVFPQTGRLGFTEPSYSSETGTYLVRAVIANPKGALRPGQFVRVHLRGAIRPNAILVPQRAVMQGAKGHFVWVLTAESKAEFRTVEAGDWHGDNWFINRGLKAGERVAVDGAMKLAAGVPVKVVEAGASTPGKAAEAKPAGGQ
jgi:membrane fusion protein (multidrug efflux system)